jgi:DNA-binding beta-propeller fold protein YncE
MRRLSGLVVVLVLAFCLPGDALAQGALSIAEQRIVDLGDAESLSLSPDGSRLAVWNWNREEPAICALDAATLAEQRCAPVPRGLIAADSVAWSPDGTRVAFTEEALRHGKDGDIWVADFEAGTATNLTDDGTEESLRAPVGTPIDVAPAWSPDGTEIVFSRSVREGEDEEGEDIVYTSLYRIPAMGGEPREVVKVADRWLVVYTGLRWLADGTILYSLDMYSDDPANGVWTVAADGGEPRQILSAREELRVLWTLVVDVSAKGQALLLADWNVYAVLDLATGEVTALTLASGEGRPGGAAFSPDGSRLLVLDNAADPDGQLVVIDLATGTEQIVSALDLQVGVRDYRSGLIWAANNLVFGPGDGRNGLLVQLTAA